MPEISGKLISKLIDKSYQGRKNILKMAKFGEVHIGGAYSSLDIITVLFNQIMKHDPINPKWEQRDRFILSAGHKCLALYVTLADLGYFEEEILWTYNTFDTRVPMHPDEKVLPGVEFPTGSLGHGLPVAGGIAVTAKRKGAGFKVFCLLGDGECSEGSVWEAAMAASHHKLDNLVAIVDRNRLQVNGRTEEIMDTSPFEDKFASFGWEVKTIDGHNFRQIYESLAEIPFKKGKPSVVIADTLKCKGLAFGEDNFKFHHWHCDPEKIDEDIGLVEKVRREELAKVGT
ncbi:MAG: transketolase [Candidatus Humimicrobiaceae bacterium]